MIRTWCFQLLGPGSIPDQGTKVPKEKWVLSTRRGGGGQANYPLSATVRQDGPGSLYALKLIVMVHV